MSGFELKEEETIFNEFINQIYNKLNQRATLQPAPVLSKPALLELVIFFYIFLYFFFYFLFYF